MLSGVNGRAIASLLINARGSAPLQMITSAQLIQSAWMTACIKAQICRALGMLARCHLMTLSGAVSSKAHSIRAGNAAPSGREMQLHRGEKPAKTQEAYFILSPVCLNWPWLL